MSKYYPNDMQQITIFGRRWFERTNGNTYFSVQIWIDDRLAHTIPYEYGYDDQYLQAAMDWLEDNGHIKREHYPESGSTESPHMWRDRTGIKLVASVADVGRKRDL